MPPALIVLTPKDVQIGGREGTEEREGGSFPYCSSRRGGCVFRGGVLALCVHIECVGEGGKVERGRKMNMHERRGLGTTFFKQWKWRRVDKGGYVFRSLYIKKGRHRL